MKINVIGRTKDYRTGTHVVYATVLIDDYLNLVGENFGEFHIQRKRENHKAYKRLEKDILKGALLPSITLAVKPDYVDKLNHLITEDDLSQLQIELAQAGIVNILDGLQRTYILKDLKEAGNNFKEDQTLLLEFWLEKDIKHLIYRIIVLNSGQKPMSMRHQVELLFLTIRERLEKDIEGLEIYMEKEGQKRNAPKKFPLDRLVTAYQSFLTKSPEVKRENIVATKLLEDDILDSDEEQLDKNFNNFKKYLSTYNDFDNEVFRIYSNGKSNWLADENVMNSFFAALSDFGSISEKRRERIDVALQALNELLKKSVAGEDPLGLAIYEKVKTGIDPKKDNVGFATRKLIVSTFKEFFREEGEKSLEECWALEAK
jgi:hypothetical protein